ncbi:extracellular solute-binding protein [Litorilinea aerophila]|uniref:Extracellular solute-binding protein n=1 Tax=Litorilinea aerophila TaxID=1204385 RepID=A0A540VI18_9CHLR|nr:extracellular solute-binding protein [Litorilinea aerophila]MCC9076481.1 extracellular solute-binding protein [Litorilinea aerophila]GIV79610.1 MAG: sugar ABC transporter substrate-binding protein [Litorilinea sp.]
MPQRTVMKQVALGMILALLALVLAACPAPAQPGAPASSGQEAAPAEASGPVEITVWAQANNVEHWRADGPAKAAEMVTDFEITVNPVNDDSGWGDYKKKFTLAADAGEAPDIVLSGHEDVPVWANAGYIIEFTECRESYPEFDDVIDSLWDSVTWQGKIWGVPQDTEARPMYYNKTKLAELGWSEEEINSLPERIKNGEFTLDDLIVTAKQAVDAGVVEPGYGYWHRPSKGGDFLQYYHAYGGRLYDAEADKLVVTQDALEQWYAFQRRVVEEGITPENFIGTEWSIWHSTVSAGEVLFWNGGIWQWADWATNYVADKGGQDFLFSFAGYALQPSGIPGRPGSTLSHPLVYMITSPQASGRNNQAAACALLAKTTTPEINTLHAVESTHLGILKSQADYPEYANDRLLSDTLYMLDYNFYQPNHVMYGPYFDILWDFMVRAENGELSPADAASQAVQQLQAELGDYLIVE